MSGKRLMAAALAVALLQAGFLGWIIAGRAAVLRSGTEVLLKVEPVDPRDLLRGDYVRLSYEISRIPVSMIENLPTQGSSGTKTLIVRLAEGGDGYWHPRTAWLDAAPAPAGPGEVDIAGQMAEGRNLADPGASVSPRYGIERYYVPEGEGLAIERDMRLRDFAVKVAVARSGRAQIKALLDGDTTLFEEPLY